MRKTKNIDILNIGLIVISLIIAIKIPFKLFLFSFAIFGPLHYLTEITWLKKRNYYIKSNSSWVNIYITIAVLLSIYPIFTYFKFNLISNLDALFLQINALSNIIVFTSLLFAIGLVYITKTKKLITVLLATLCFSFVIEMYFSQFFILITYLIPTLIHVYIFTLFFILYGAIKSKSSYGFYVALTLFFVPFFLLLIPLNYTYNSPSKEILAIFSNTNLSSLSNTLAFIINKITGNFYTSTEIIIKAQIFIAFAYTYHYLNWFSKTSIIGWKKAISKKQGFLILFIWILSSSMYLYDYQVGFIIVAFLSFLHVLLEFPLNIITIREVFRKLLRS